MSKGHLDVADLEKYKKADLQELARQLGVSDEGTVKELAARCAAVEVEIPDEDEQQPEPAEQPQDEQQPEPQKLPEGMVMVEVVQTYQDLELKRIVKKDERLPMKAERAAVIIGKALGKVVED